MKRKRKKPSGITPSFPILRDELIPTTVKGEAPKVTSFGTSLPGVDWRTLPAGEERATSRLADEFYFAYMHSERWRVNRQPALDRARGCCERCGRHDALEVHHLTYERFMRERPEDLQALCSTCHANADQERKAAWAAMLPKWRAEAEEKREYSCFDGFMRAVTSDDDWESNCDSEFIDQMYERFEQRREGRDDA